eukprot:356266-Chlamydomonas_euryale.AAC.5
MVASYELSVLMTPATEAAFRAHPHARFRAAAAHGAAAALLPPPPLQPSSLPAQATAVRFRPLGSGGGNGSGGSAACVWVPLPYLLPPLRYASGDAPWMADVEHGGVDSYGPAAPTCAGVCGELHGIPQKLSEDLKTSVQNNLEVRRVERLEKERRRPNVLEFWKMARCFLAAIQMGEGAEFVACHSLVWSITPGSCPPETTAQRGC